MLLPTMLAAPPVVWYGPKTVAFNLETAGNPYDPKQNDVEVEFRGPGGAVERRMAYFDGDGWRATLLSHTKGEFTPTVVYNGARGVSLPPVALTTIKPFGFVRLAGSTNFRLDDGTPYWPLGHNLAWGNGNEDLTADLKQMGADGLNWARIWADHWDGKNPFWKEGETPKTPGPMIPSVLDKWDGIVAAADAAGVRFQMTLFHHGPWSTRTDSNWKENPWNAANKGGFLKTPNEFFTNPRAKALSKAWLRYAVARYGHSPSIMAWEIFNEVQWVDAVVDKQADVVGRWHDEMADYLRSIDPYHHLVTTSSDLSLPIYREVDYYQPHTYPPSVEAAVAAAPRLDKPLFFGEFGPGQFNDTRREVQVGAIRDGIWTALLSLQAGAGQYWSWDLIPKMNLEPEFARAARLMREIGADHSAFRVAPVALDAGLGGDFAGQAGGGWETSKQFAYRLPEDAPLLGRLSPFLQGKAHPEMQPQPVSFTFTTPKATTFSVEVTGAAKGGGNLRLDNPDGPVYHQMESFSDDHSVRSLSIQVAAGTHTVTLTNDGPDWVQLGRISIPGIAPKATARAITTGTRAVLRIKGEKGLSVALDGLGLKDGRYSAHIADLDGGDTTVPVVVKAGKGGRIALPGADTVVIVGR